LLVTWRLFPKSKIRKMQTNTSPFIIIASAQVVLIFDHLCEPVSSVGCVWAQSKPRFITMSVEYRGNCRKLINCEFAVF
jgi:hypothetical protein